MSRIGLVAFALGVVGMGFLAGCESGTAMRMELPVATAVVSAAPAGELTAAGGGKVGQGHLGTAFALYFPMDRAVDNAWTPDINFNFNVSSNISVELAASWTKADVEDTAPVYSGELQMIPLTVGAQYGDRFGDTGRWYSGLGLGWIMNDFDGSGVSADDALLVYLMGGVDIPVSDLNAICVELRYQLANTDLSNGVTLDLDAFLFRINVVWLF